MLTIDGSEVGRGCMTLMVSLIYQNRAIPLVWCVFDRPKGRLSAQEHIALLNELQRLLRADAEVILLGDGEFDSVELQSYLAQHNWEYVCRTAKDTWVCVKGSGCNLTTWRCRTCVSVWKQWASPNKPMDQ